MLINPARRHYVNWDGSRRHYYLDISSQIADIIDGGGRMEPDLHAVDPDDEHHAERYALELVIGLIREVEQLRQHNQSSSTPPQGQS